MDGYLFHCKTILSFFLIHTVGSSFFFLISLSQINIESCLLYLIGCCSWLSLNIISLVEDFCLRSVHIIHAFMRLSVELIVKVECAFVFFPLALLLCSSDGSNLNCAGCCLLWEVREKFFSWRTTALDETFTFYWYCQTSRQVSILHIYCDWFSKK